MRIGESLPRTGFSLALAVCVLMPAGVSKQNIRQLTAESLLQRIRRLEKETANTSGEPLLSRLRAFGVETVRSRLSVAKGIVAAVYERGPRWRTRPYFAVDYNRDHYLYLEDIDPEFQSALAERPFWASIVRTYPDRQVMFEIALPEKVYKRLRPGQRVSLTCELAAVIRGGKSVYGRLLSIRMPD